MENTFDNTIIGLYLYSRYNIVTDISKEFLDFSGYSLNELIGKSLIEIGDMLKINSQICLNALINNFTGYIFTKLEHAIEVDISVSEITQTNETVYSFIEKPNSRINDKLIFEEHLFIENISGVAVYSVPDLILLKANKRYLNLINSTLNEDTNIIGKPINEIIKGFVGSQAQIVWKSILELKRTSYIKEIENNSSSVGTTYWGFAQRAICEKGKIKYIFETVSEATEMIFKNQCLERQHLIIEKQKKKLDEHNIHIDSIIENLSEGLIFLDNKGEFIMVNSEAKRLVYKASKGITLTASLKNTKIFDMTGKEILFENLPSVRALRGERVKSVKLLVCHSSEDFFVEISSTPVYNTSGNLTMVVSCFHDITESINQSMKIEKQKKELEAIIDTFDLPVIRLSSTNKNIFNTKIKNIENRDFNIKDIKIKDINKRAFTFIKLLLPDIESVSQIKNGNTDELLKMFKTIEYFKCIKEVLTEKKTKYLNKKNYFVNGTEIYWNIIFEPLFDINGQIEEILILIIDVTAETKSTISVEKELKSQGEFLVNVSHELKTPLNVIFSTAQLFNLYCNSGSLDEKKSLIVKYIESIKQNSYRLSKLINNIVDISKIQAGFFELNLSNNNIVAVVEEIVMSVTNFTESKGLNIIFDTDVEEKIIACDPEKIERIILNLISNAIKFTDEGGEILVDIKDKNEFVEISVRDTGIGIDTKHLDMIFDRFKQIGDSLSRNAEGTGIGLNLVKSIVDLHNGNIHVESELGHGSKFTVKLPSIKVTHQSTLYNRKVRSENDLIQVELSDIYS